MQKTKVLFDARWIVFDKRHVGVDRYSLELAKAMAARNDLDLAWLIYDTRQLEELPKRPYILANNSENVILEYLFLPRLINKSGYKIVYALTPLIGIIGKKFKLVLTVHDVIFYHFKTPPQWMAWYKRLGWLLFFSVKWPFKLLLKSADAITAVSETAKQDLYDFNLTKKSVTIVHNAVVDDFIDNTPRDHSTSNTVVFMGAFTPYKNVECLIDSLAYVPGVTLQLLSKVPPARHAALNKYIAQRNLTDRVVFFNGATDQEYKTALKNARCALSASKMEGFGLPLIEAQQAGVPFAAANTPIFREVGADSMLFFDPNSPKDCARCIKAYANKQTSSTYAAKGRQNAKRFRWEQSAAAAAKVCHSLAQDSP